MKDLLQRLDLGDVQDLARLHVEGIEDLLARRILRREPLWSESLAVGSQEYIERIKKDCWQRTRFDEECVRQDDQSQAWVVRESPDAYVADSRSRSPV